MTYELWDMPSGNWMGDYTTFAEVVAIVRDVREIEGESGVRNLAVLIWEDGAREYAESVEGDELLRMIGAA